MPNPKIKILPLRRESTPASQQASPPLTTRPKNVVARKSRTSKPKVRTGCSTCKIRRVKCDETRPECVKCTSTGRKCDGYSAPPPRRKANAKIPKDTVLRKDPGFTVQTEDECRALAFFHGVTAVHMANYLDAHFLTRVAFQLAHAEDSIRHAMAALGALSETRDGGSVHLPRTASTVGQPKFAPWNKHCLPGDPANEFAHLQYLKAIAALSEQLRGPNPSIETALMSCMLFVCIEVLRGNVGPGMTHVKSGLNIAMTAIANTDLRQRPTVHDIKGNVLPFFDRVELFYSRFGHTSDWQYRLPVEDAVPSKFFSLFDARDSIVHLMNLSHRFVQTQMLNKDNMQISPEDMVRHSELLQSLDAWKRRVDIMLFSDTNTPLERQAVKALIMDQINAKIWLHLVMHPEEVYTDQLIPDFEEIVTLAEELQTVAGYKAEHTKRKTTQVFKVESTSALYTVCLKCRHPVIRRRATAILKSTPRTGGLWDTDMAAAVSEHLIALEEKNLTVLDGSQLPPEQDRVHTVQIESEPGLNPLRHTITLYAKPDGLDSRWWSWQEEIVLRRRPEDLKNFGQYGEQVDYAYKSETPETQESAWEGHTFANHVHAVTIHIADPHAYDVAVLKRETEEELN